MEYQMEKLKLEGIEREESTTKMKDEVRSALEILNKTMDKFEMSLKVKANSFEQSIAVRVGELRKTVDLIAGIRGKLTESSLIYHNTILFKLFFLIFQRV
jgi:hypothetical protein